MQSRQAARRGARKPRLQLLEPIPSIIAREEALDLSHVDGAGELRQLGSSCAAAHDDLAGVEVGAEGLQRIEEARGEVGSCGGLGRWEGGFDLKTCGSGDVEESGLASAIDRVQWRPALHVLTRCTCTPQSAS